MNLAKIKSTTPSSQFEYTLTEEDVLWSLKMIYGESGKNLLDAACVLWCMTNRLYVLRDAYKNKNFSNLIRAYSQPINPAWYRDGRLAKVYKDSSAASEDKFIRREQIRNMKIEDFSNEQRKLIELWSEGKLPNPVPNAVHFAVPAVASKHKGTPGLIQKGLEIVFDEKNRGSNCIDTKGNVFYATNETTKWPKNKITMIAKDGSFVSDSSPAEVKKIIELIK
jgi:predicted RNA-binding protein